MLFRSVTEEPKAEEPAATEEPKAEEPAATEEPKAEEPAVTEEPKAEEPGTAVSVSGVRGGHWALVSVSSMLCAQNDASTDAAAEIAESLKIEDPKPETLPTTEAPLTVTSTDVVFPNGSAIVMKVGYAVAADAIMDAVTTALTSLGKADILVEVTNPRWDREEGEKQRFDSWIVHVNLPESEAHEVFAKTKELYEQRIVIPSSNTVGSMLASQTRDSAVWAILLSCVLMLLYLRYRFRRISYGIAAVIALVFDILFTLAALGASFYLAPALGWLLVDPFKINMTVITALLTVVGYSVNDKIVVFDRIRELRGKGLALSPELLNQALNQTLSRTLLTSLTTLIVVVILYVFGGSTIHGFAFAMLIGIVIGTFSSMFVASPVLLWLSRKLDVNRDNSTGGGSVR